MINEAQRREEERRHHHSRCHRPRACRAGSHRRRRVSRHRSVGKEKTGEWMWEDKELEDKRWGNSGLSGCATTAESLGTSGASAHGCPHRSSNVRGVRDRATAEWRAGGTMCSSRIGGKARGTARGAAEAARRGAAEGAKAAEEGRGGDRETQGRERGRERTEGWEGARGRVGR